MAKIPGELDYGARPSLRSNRVDIPGQEDLIIAEAVENAAVAFQGVMAQHKQKTDRRSYARAKSDLASADVRIRRELEDEGDWENYREQYRIRIGEALDEISPGITDPTDREIFAAESNLTVERGVSAMSDMERQARQEHAMADAIDMLDDRKREILSEDSGAIRVDLLLTTQEHINAEVEAGNIPPAVGERMIKEFIGSVAVAELTTMPPRTRLAVLEAAIAANADPEAEDFKPSGSLADFLHQDERIQMARETEKLIESEEDLGIAQAAADEAVNLYRATDKDAFKNRRDHIKSLDLTPEQRKLAMAELQAAEMADRRSTTDEQNEIIKLYQGKIRAGMEGSDPDDPRTIQPFTTNMIPRAEWNKLSPGQQAALNAYSDAMAQGRSFALSTRMVKTMDGEEELPSWSLWQRMSNEEKVAVDLDSPMWLMAFTESDWRMLSQQQQLAGQGKGPDIRDIDNNKSLLLSALIDTGWVPKTGQKPEEQERYARALLEFNRRIHKEQMEPGMDNVVGYPDYGTREKILAELMMSVGYTDRDLLPFDSDYDEDEAVPFYLMTPEQREVGFSPIEGARERKITLRTGDEQTYEDYLIALAMTPEELGGAGVTYPEAYWKTRPGLKRLERAWFSLKNGMPLEETLRRLRDE